MKVATPPTVVPGVSPVDDAKVKALFKAVASFRSSQYLLYNIQVPKSIFRELAAPKQHVATNLSHVFNHYFFGYAFLFRLPQKFYLTLIFLSSTQHMELMIGLLWDRFSQKFGGDRVVILGNALCHFIKSDYKNYKNKMGDEFEWDKNLVSIVNGSFFQREGPTKWIIDVDRVYAPMNWSDNHWVGLHIKLITGSVIVFDSAYNLTKPAEPDEFMAPILDMLPLMIGDLTADFGASYTPPAVFTYDRPINISQDPSSGNSGSLAVKYMELHSQGIPFINLTNKIVENIRMNFAVDLFEQFQFPLV